MIRQQTKVRQYESNEDLISAFVNAGITSGITINHHSSGTASTAANLIVYGNTLYFDKGCNGWGHAYYFQVAIRLTEDVYLLNDISKHRAVQYEIKGVIGDHPEVYGRYITLRTLMQKKKEGEVNLHILKNVIQEYTPGKIPVAFKKYITEQTQEAAINNFKELMASKDNLTRSKYYGNFNSTIIKEITRELKKAKEDCAIIDEYLDILRQLPEKLAP